MVNLFVSLDRVVTHALDWLIMLASILVTGLIIFLVMARFVFHWSVVGVHELALIAAMWLYMSGAIVATRNREHLVVDFFVQKIQSPGARLVHQLVAAAIMLTVGVLFIYLAHDMVQWSLRRPQETPALGIPLLVPQSALVLASILCTLYALRDVMRAAVGLLARRAHDDGGS